MKNILFISAFFISIFGYSQGGYFPLGVVTGPMTTTQINAISSPQNGRLIGNSTTGTIWYYDGSSWNDTGDSIADGLGPDGDVGDITIGSSGTTATIDNSAVTNAKIATGVDAAKIANGSVSNTEFQYINSLTSNAQDQIDDKAEDDETLKITNNLSDVSNASTSRTNLGLGNVDNTADLDKPVSADTQTELDLKQDEITLTTAGSSGAATLVGSTLNIPQYSGGGGSDGNDYVTAGSVTGEDLTLTVPNQTDPVIDLSDFATDTALALKADDDEVVKTDAASPTQSLDVWMGTKAQYATDDPTNDIVFITDSIPANTLAESKVFVGGDGGAEYKNAIIIPDGATYVVEDGFQSIGVSSVILPSGLDSIMNYSFASNNIKSITLPSGISVIGAYAFNDNSLTSLSIPASVTTIRERAFQGNAITSVSIPSTVTELGRGVFSSNNISSATIGTGITAIPDLLFSGNSLTSITVPSGFTSIGDYAFSSNNLSSVTLPTGLITIGFQSFANNNLSTIAIPSTVTSIEDGAFLDNNLSSISLPSGITSISAASFRSNNLTSVVIPSGVTTIEQYAFNDNDLTSITIPASVTDIEFQAFTNNNLTSVSLPTGIDVAALAFDPGVTITYY